MPRTLVQLQADDLPEVGILVNRVWSAAYGSVPHPHFTPGYLEWLYGGPMRHRHVLIGRRIGGRLIAFKGLLARQLTLRGRVLRADLSTHLSIDPSLDLRDRMKTSAALVRAQSFDSGAAWPPRPSVDVTLAYFEGTTNLVRSTARSLVRKGLVRSTIPFVQSVVSPPAFRAAQAITRPRHPVRPATPEDAPAIARLFEQASAGLPLAVVLSPAEIGHHFFGLPRSRAHIATWGAMAAGAILYYLMDTVKTGQISRLVVVEFLLADSTAAAVPLLAEAVEFARASRARGVVLENATYLDPALCRACGIGPSPRRMLLSTFGREPLAIGNRFLLDVK